MADEIFRTENALNVVNGPSLIYASLRDIQIALRTSTAESAVRALLMILPNKVEQAIEPELIELEEKRGLLMADLVKRFQQQYGYPGDNQFKIVDKQGYEREVFLLKVEISTEYAKIIRRKLDALGFLFREGRTVERGNMSLANEEVEDNEEV